MGWKKKDRNKNDKYFQLAKEQGFRSRASFKLIQLNRKYDFLSSARSCLDLCAAPGGWLQVAVKTMPVGSFILGVDLLPIKPIRGARTIVGDITSPQTLSAIRHESNNIEFDVITCDGSPNVGGAWMQEAYTQILVTLEGIRIATKLLRAGGTFVAKVFRSRDYTTLLYVMNQLFGRVEATKPQASRYTSAEIFVVCSEYKAPKKIDPKLLDPNHVFQDVTEAPRPMGPDALLRQVNKQKRNRQGYEDGLSTTSKTMSAAAFVAAKFPGDMLGKHTKISFIIQDHSPTEETEGLDIATILEKIEQHSATTDEIKELCGDLQVLGKAEYRKLLTWHRILRKDFQEMLEQQQEDDQEGKDEEQMPEKEKKEAALLAELEELKLKIDQKNKRQKKKRREMKKKSKIRAAQFSAQEGIGEDVDPDGEQFFDLTKISAGTVLEDETAVPDDENFEEDEEESDDGDEDEDDDDEAQLKYDALMEEYLEHSYQQFLERQGVKQKTQRKKKRKRIGEDEDLELEEEQLLKSDDDDAKQDFNDYEDDETVLPEQQNQENELIVKFDEAKAGVPRTARAVTAHWFAQDIFNDQSLQKIEKQQQLQQAQENGTSQLIANVKKEQSDIDEDQETIVANKDKKQKDKNDKRGQPAKDSELLVTKEKKRRKVAFANDQNGAALEDDEDEDGQTQTKSRLNQAAQELRKQQLLKQQQQSSKGKDFQVVANVQTDDDGMTDSEDEFQALDDQAKAEVLALAKKMLRGRAKTDIIEAAYNRYVFHDEGLPTWFSEDEVRHMRPDPVITKAEVEDEKARLRAVDARPIKKVAEAKARKKKRLRSRLEKARKKAEDIASQEDMPLGSRMREVSKIYKKARSEGKPKKLSKMTRKERRKFLSSQKPVDRRMKSDKRGQKRAEQRLKGVKGKKGMKGGKGKAGGARGRHK